MHRSALAVLLLAPGCTLALPTTAIGTVAVHNDSSDTQWHYTSPIIVTAVIGLAFDVILGSYYVRHFNAGR